MTRLLIATTNAKKLEEFKALFTDLPLELLDLKFFKKLQEVKETGKTFKENAALKALDYSQQTNMLTLAEDSGLCCDALEGAPGVYSARFAGEAKSDADNNRKLLKLLEKVPDNCRGAHYISAMAVAEPEKLVGVVEGAVYGSIAHQLAGSNGFGYDPLFFYPPYQKTFGEVSAEMKHRVSHRAQAFGKIKKILRAYLQSLRESGR